MKKEPHIPVVIGIAILLVGLSGLIYLVENMTVFFTQADELVTPEKVTVSNISDTMFAVSWLTKKPVFGYLEYQEKSLLTSPRQKLDQRDTGTKLNRYNTHYVVVSGLRPQTQYEYAIISNQHKYTPPQARVTTGVVLPPPPLISNPVFGTLVDRHNQSVSEALIYLSFTGSGTISNLAGGDGTWFIPLSNLRSEDASRHFIPSFRDILYLNIVNQESESKVTARLENASPLPPVRLGENYDLLKLSTWNRRGPLVAQAQNPASISTSVNSPLVIYLPLDGAAIPSGFPAFKGIALSGKKVIITVSGEKVVTGKTTSAQNGTWNWTPDSELPPGNYTASVTTFTDTNQPVTQAVSFMILKSGTSVLGDATPAASLNPSPKATLIPSPVASSSPLPKLGNSTPTLWVLFLTSVLISFGIIAFIKQPQAKQTNS